MKKKVWIMAVSAVLVLALAITGTIAYLTDRDSKTNVFTFGNVDIQLEETFTDNAVLTPGVNIEKKPVIKNIGKNDAWVWLTFSIPSALDNLVQGTEVGSDANIIHWNPMGATTEGFVTEERVANAVAAKHLPADITADEILQNNMTWNVFNSLGAGVNAYTETIDGVEYNTYVLLYNKAITKDEVTLPNIYNVYMDARVDITPDGDLYLVKGGVTTDIKWNIVTNGEPEIVVRAYGVQVEGFATVQEAYAAYVDQWGKLN
ncbi:MAG: hypothetical protein J6R33_02375 [Clostridia bacterium]|nr:hypothetical protein [Clostridia bacterium]